MALIDNFVTRFPNGVTNASVNSLFNALKCEDQTLYHTFFEDFDYYTAAQWTVTETQAGATQALANGDGGLLLLTNSAADDDLNAMQKIGESFTLTAGKKLFFRARLAVSDATESDFVIGLQVTDTTPLDVTDGIYFLKADGAATVSFIARKDATTGSVSAAAVATVVAATQTEYAFYYDGGDRIYYAVGGVILGYLTVTSTAGIPDTSMTISFAIQNGEAVAKTMTVDYVYVAKER